MAKMKTFAVEVEIPIKRMLIVQARRPNGAAERALSEDGWADAMRYEDDTDLSFYRRDAKVLSVREVGA